MLIDPALRFGPSFSWFCIWQVLHFQSRLDERFISWLLD